eukprot:TRINITY_DN872_c0_g1_i1.p1 TRINITY_DN872_c0_g1~~TRINITY_DN872_c0_g1_i1.p1  ORF type:complete len:259 (+),score=48.36 TRINITY_DN872_c0_g1_i1:72-848(+)
MGRQVSLALILGFVVTFCGSAARSATRSSHAAAYPDDFDDEEGEDLDGFDASEGEDGSDDDDIGESSSSASESLQPMDFVSFRKDGIMSLNPKRKGGEREMLSRYKAGQLGQIRKALGQGRYLVCVGHVQKTTAGVFGFSKKEKDGTKCPGGEVELSSSELQVKTEKMEVWDESTQDMKVKVVDLFSAGQRVKILRPGQIGPDRKWNRNAEGVVSQVLRGNKYRVCVGGKLRNNLGVSSCTGLGFVKFPAYQLQKLGR